MVYGVVTFLFYFPIFFLLMMQKKRDEKIMQFLNGESNGDSIQFFKKSAGVRSDESIKTFTGVALQIWRQSANDELIEQIDWWTQDTEIRL